MARIAQNEGGEDLYSEPAAAASEQSEESTAEEMPTAVIPKALLAGKDFNPGDKIILRIVRVMPDGAEVAYAEEGEETEGAPEVPEQAMAQGPMMAEYD